MAIRYSSNDRYELIEIDRPESRGALDKEHLLLLKRCLDQIHSDRPLILTGCGDSFCSGLDLKELAKMSNEEKKEINICFASLLTQISQLRNLSIVFVNGPCVGGGCGIAAAANYTVVSSSARFKCPELSIGLAPAQIYPYLKRRITNEANLLRFLSAQWISANEAISNGIAHECVTKNMLLWVSDRLSVIEDLFAFSHNISNYGAQDHVKLSEIFINNE